MTRIWFFTNLLAPDFKIDTPSCQGYTKQVLKLAAQVISEKSEQIIPILSQIYCRKHGQFERNFAAMSAADNEKIAVKNAFNILKMKPVACGYYAFPHRSV
ncbi:MAG: hypothetical protein BVN35_20565 [Proteobacteria bacterium ST_bin11]|nr:MAG: hypothetical protein BVN35_20565 [Proteobacteria bacterium ST_bin11]